MSSSLSSSTSSSSSSTSSGGPLVAPPLPPLTAAGLLAQYAASPDPPQAALDQAIAERTGIQEKNEQLWRLIERQRAGYNQLLQELERARVERDTYKARLKTAVAGAPGWTHRVEEGSAREPTIPPVPPLPSITIGRADEGSAEPVTPRAIRA